MGLPVWKVIYVASNWKEAEEMKDRLAKEGLMVMLRTGSPDKQSARNVELLVPRLEAREADTLKMRYIETARVQRENRRTNQWWRCPRHECSRTSRGAAWLVGGAGGLRHPQRLRRAA